MSLKICKKDVLFSFPGHFEMIVLKGKIAHTILGIEVKKGIHGSCDVKKCEIEFLKTKEYKT